MNKQIIILSATLIILLGLIYFFAPGTYQNDFNCNTYCTMQYWDGGVCEWPIFMEKNKFEEWAIKINKPELTFPYSNVVNMGPCVVKIFSSHSMHCGSEGQCNCYCFNK
ncbi:MAG: hypothetical protein DRP06_03430 [Candidatus Aenigmatarchaeota archaeon]|nr:MAG: hypothetical protein DRP06_03430 [Candidatus Aenigmarchaeota archaeon]